MIIKLANKDPKIHPSSNIFFLSLATKNILLQSNNKIQTHCENARRRNAECHLQKMKKKNRDRSESVVVNDA